MLSMIFSGVVGFGLAVVIYLLFRLYRSKEGKGSVEIRASIEKLRSVGELVVFRIITKEIVTTFEHWFGPMGKKYFQWLVSSKKMAMIFEFEIDFRYDLRNPDFVIQDEGNGKYRLKMPQCFYENHIRDISFYDEQNARLLPWLLPDLLNKVFDPGFSEEAKNRLKEEAKEEANRMAKELVHKMRSEVHSSARQTLEALAKGFNAEHVTVDFTDSELVHLEVVSPPPGKSEGAVAENN